MTNTWLKGQPYVVIVVSVVVSVLAVVGWGSFFGLPGKAESVQKFQLEKSTSIVLDASKRIIIVNEKGQVCSEPSPDTISLVAARLITEGEVTTANETKISGKLDALREANLTKLFERSQGIQALRDGMYRLCEGYINQAIPQAVYESQMTDLTSTLNFIVPIELCTKLHRDLFELSMNSNQGTYENKSVLMEHLAKGEMLSSKFTKFCIESGLNFSRKLSENAAQRTLFRLNIEREQRAQELEFKRMEKLNALGSGTDVKQSNEAPPAP